MMIKQVITELKAQPVIAWVTIIGTALAMFLIMVVVMLNQVNVVDLAPESNRHRLLYATFMRGRDTTKESNIMNTSSLGAPVIDAVFRPLTTPERITVFTKWNDEQTVSTPGVAGFIADTKSTDEQYFRVYDFTFLAGAPYDSADVASHLRKAVITESIARRLFNSADEAVGRDIEIDEVPHRVSGVVKEVSPVTNKAYSQVWTPLPYKELDEWSAQWGIGEYAVAVLAHEGQPLSEVEEEIKTNLAKFNALKAAENIEVDFNGAPYTEEGERAQVGSNNPADLAKEHRHQLIVYAILLLVPAINLSSMTRSRLAWRTGEIGVRRAFGATRGSIIVTVLCENMLITLAGGAIGLLLSFGFGSLFFDTIYSAGTFAAYNTIVTLGPAALFAWSTFGYALLFCFILNLLSTGIPAWRASRLNPVDALAATSK